MKLTSVILVSLTGALLTSALPADNANNRLPLQCGHIRIEGNHAPPVWLVEAKGQCRRLYGGSLDFKVAKGCSCYFHRYVIADSLIEFSADIECRTIDCTDGVEDVAGYTNDVRGERKDIQAWMCERILVDRV